MDPRTMRGSANYAAVADKLSTLGERLLDAVAIKPGMELLDVACGTGHATIPAAREGARVTGLDQSGDLLAIARERAADAMVEIEWIEGDVHTLPFGDASFDRVISIVGHMFASDPGSAVAEMRRVCRPGGAIGLASWTPEGPLGGMLGAVPNAEPLLWGTEERLREVLGDDAELARGEIEWSDLSAAEFASFMVESLEALGTQPGELRNDFVARLERENLDEDGRLRFRAGYVTSVVRP
jgi:SAM-dependent methyltransferase